MHALDRTCLVDEVVDQLRTRDLPPQLDDAVLHVHIDLTLRDVRVAEEHRLDLRRERRVVEVLRLLAKMRSLLADAVCGRRGAAPGPTELAPTVPGERRNPLRQLRSASAAVGGVEEERDDRVANRQDG